MVRRDRKNAVLGPSLWERSRIRAINLDNAIRACWRHALFLFAALAGGCDGGESPAGQAAPAATAQNGASEVIARGKAVSERACAKLCHREANIVNAPLYGPSMKARREAVAAYSQVVAILKIQEPDRYEASKHVIDAIAAEPDLERRTELWLNAYLQRPTFDSAKNKMLPINPPLSEQDLNDVIAYLLTFR